MNTRTLLISATLAGILNCTAVGAQVLGGAAGGVLGGGASGALSGPLSGMHDASVLGRGSASGAFGGDVESGALRRTTRATQRGVGRTTEAAERVGSRARSEAEAPRGLNAGALVTGAASGSQAVESPLTGATQWTGSAASAADGAALANITPPDAPSQPAAAPALDAPLDAQDAHAEEGSPAPRSPLINAGGRSSGGGTMGASAAHGDTSANAHAAAAAEGSASTSADR